MSEFLIQMNKEMGQDLPRVDISPKILTRPLRQSHRAKQEGLIKNFSHFTAWEKKSSLFEWNPGIHFQVGAKKDDNLLGIGLYMVSSRQLSLLRNALVDDFEAIHEILNERKLKKIWGGLQGDKYIRFPKGFDPDREEAQYLWYRQFYLSQTFSRTEVVDKNFFEKRLEDLRVALPFLQWIRKAVGVYRKGSAR